jgi:predicted DCC family thiol-disulfide oxidoreductase YuxK
MNDSPENKSVSTQQTGIYVLFTSHRSRDKALREIGDPAPQAYYSWRRETGKGVYLLTEAQIEAIAHLARGWRRLRGPYEDLLQCWK